MVAALRTPASEDMLAQAAELRDKLNAVIIEFVDAPRPDGVILSMSGILMGATAAVVDALVLITPPGPVRTDFSMWAVEQLGLSLLAGATVPGGEGFDLHTQEVPAGQPKN